MLSALVAVFNFLPLPMLDGGHVVLTLIEKIRGKALPTKVLAAIQFYLWFAVFRLPGLHSPHFHFGRFGMTVFCFLLPVLIVFGDQPCFVHAVFIIGTIGKLQLAWYFATSGKTRPGEAGPA